MKDIWDSHRKVAMPVLPKWKMKLPEKEHSKRRFRNMIINTGKYAAAIVIAAGITLMLNNNETSNTIEKVYRHVLIQNTTYSESIVLSDGTRVHVNTSGSLKYPESFSTDRREVWLNGEAYFEVSENAACPFLVHTDMMDIKVLGTRFNATAYESDQKTTVTLIEGKVELYCHGEVPKTLILEPGQQAVFWKNNHEIATHSVDPDLYIAWKDGYYKFVNTSFGEIAERMEKMYHVKIVFADESLSQIPYSGTFIREQSLKEVLDMMHDVKPFEYSIKDNLVTIRKNKEVKMIR